MARCGDDGEHCVGISDGAGNGVDDYNEIYGINLDGDGDSRLKVIFKKIYFDRGISLLI